MLTVTGGSFAEPEHLERTLSLGLYSENFSISCPVFRREALDPFMHYTADERVTPVIGRSMAVSHCRSDSENLTFILADSAGADLSGLGASLFLYRTL